MTKKLLGLVVVAVVFALVANVGCAKQTSTKASADLQRIHFDFDKSNIKAEFEPVLQGNAAWMQANPSRDVVIEGHCDERGTDEYNIALGDRRANGSKRYLKSMGVNAGKMSTISYGEEKPSAKCHDESCWWQNRRAEFIEK